MEILGLIIGILALLAGIVFGGYHIYQSERNKDKLIDALVEVKTQLGEGVARDLKALGEVTLKVIEKDWDVTRQAIEKDGEESRRVILDVHKSIKEELGK